MEQAAWQHRLHIHFRAVTYRNKEHFLKAGMKLLNLLKKKSKDSEPIASKDFLKKVYSNDEMSGAYIIEVSLNKYTEVFNEWDPAPFKLRDLDPDLLFYMEECAADIPLKYPVILDFYLPEEKFDHKKEEVIITGMENYFSFNINIISKKLFQTNRKALFDAVIGFSFLAGAWILEPVVVKRAFLKILLEGLFIGGWVFLWEAFYTFFFENSAVYQKRKQYRRFLKASIRFKYAR